MPAPKSSVDSAEIRKFAEMAEAWWDPVGKFRPLHRMTPCRMDYVVAQIAGEFGRDRTAPRPLDGLRILDMGCGGGLASEPLARLGANVVGADAAEESIGIARHHAAAGGLEIDYRHTTAEALAESGEVFDAVVSLEVIEHVADPGAFLATAARLLRPGGVLIVSTLNRTVKSHLGAIVGAEYLLRWLPVGTHDWARFVTPDELYGMMEEAGLDPVDRKGMVPDLMRGDWRLSPRDLSVNYIATAIRPEV